MASITAPTQCPSCGSVLQWVNHILYCKNTECESQTEKRLEHFAKTLKIKGLGPAAVSKLQLDSIADLYEITEGYIATALSSDRLAQKLIGEIENSKRATMNQLLPAFSIRLIGKTAAEKLSFVCKQITDINEDTCRSAGLGPKATTNLLAWLRDQYPSYAGMPFSFEFEKSTKVNAIKGTVCISGKLNSFKTKALATKALLEEGYAVKSTLTKDVTILVNESGVESAKTRTARTSGITIVTDLHEIIGE